MCRHQQHGPHGDGDAGTMGIGGRCASCVSNGCEGEEVDDTAGRLKGMAGNRVEREGVKKQPSSCGIGLFFASTTTLQLGQVASLTIFRAFPQLRGWQWWQNQLWWVGCGGGDSFVGWADSGGMLALVMGLVMTVGPAERG
jgi:hypothetical protein